MGPSDMEDERSKIRRGMIRRGIFRMQVDRGGSISQQVVATYAQNASLHNLEMKIKFSVEQGQDGGGLRRELVGCFWDELACKHMEGSTEKVPILGPGQGIDYYHVGRFVSHTYILTGYFPICFSRVFTKALICGENTITDDELLSSFYNFVDSFEADALQRCASAGCDDGTFQQVIIPLLSRYHYNSIPIQSEVKGIMPNLARFALLEKPYYALSEIRRGMHEAHPSFWVKCNKPSLVTSLYDILTPTTERVLAMVAEPDFQTISQERVFDYLRRFIRSLSSDDLGKFLRFTTGYSVCGPVYLSIEFNSVQGFQRRPTANTCTPSLTLSVVYSSYNDFSFEFRSLLNSSNFWFFDSV